VNGDPVLITGCSTGIGRATAAHLAQRGWKVYASARRPQTLADLSGCEHLQLDVTDDASATAAVEQISVSTDPSERSSTTPARPDTEGS
jgi:NADP-dependent 3-hydroxy acid dehydrogenase YdfG